MMDWKRDRIENAGLGEEICLFDFQVNGFAGVDFQSETIEFEALKHAVERLRWHRMAKILLTLTTDKIDTFCRKLEAVESYRKRDPEIEATIAGYHLEGPWITTEDGYNGAHSKDLVCTPRETDYRKLEAASNGRIKLITLAPEVEGCIPMIEILAGEGVRVGLGHTNASAEVIDDAIRAGATLGTHVGNAVPSLIHRHDNVIQRLLARDELIACFIPDGIHLPPFVLKNFYRAKPPDKVLFTTDCMAAAGAPPGRFELRHHQVEVGEDGIVHLPNDDRFAGSSLTLDQGVKNLQAWLGFSEAEALEHCSTRAAAYFGVEL